METTYAFLKLNALATFLLVAGDREEFRTELHGEISGLRDDVSGLTERVARIEAAILLNRTI